MKASFLMTDYFGATAVRQMTICQMTIGQKTYCQENKSHSTEHKEFETHPRLLISHLIDIVVVLFI